MPKLPRASGDKHVSAFKAAGLTNEQYLKYFYDK